MIAAMAVAAGAAFADPITSANIVGFEAMSDGGNPNTGIGAVFCPIGLGETYKLTSMQVEGEDGEFMKPGLEYLQMLDPDGAATIGRFTYVSAEALQDNYEEEWEDYKDAIGWWRWSKDIFKKIDKEDYTDKIGDADADNQIPVGTAFLGFLKGNELKFVSNGEVPLVPTKINDGGNPNPFFLNYLPVTIDINKITVSCDGDFMKPGLEYLQVLDPDGAATIARYTYVSAEALEDNYEDEWEDYKEAIGWWNWSKDIFKKIDKADYTDKITSMGLTPGFAFLGFLKGNELDFNFPPAIEAK